MFHNFCCISISMLILGFSTVVKSVDTLYIAAGIYDTDGNLIHSPFSVSRSNNIVLGPNGNLFVTDESGGDSAGRVLEYDRNANLVKEVISGLYRPRGIAFDPQGNLFLGANGTIMEFDLNGNVLNNGLISTGIVESIVIDSSGFLYYTAERGGDIGRYDLNNVAPVNTRFITGINGPFGLALDGKGYIYVTNYYGDKVGKYDLAGNTVNAAFISGSTNGLNTPYRLAFDSTGNLYVTNTNYSYVTGPVGFPGEGWVSKYDENGNRLHSPMPYGISNLWAIAIVPEPSAVMLAGMSFATLVLISCHRKNRSVER